MAADARTDLAPPRALSLAAVRVTPVQALTVVIAASVIGRTLVGWLRATPVYFPDEYIYSEVSRSIAEHGRPMVRGASAHFPALLQPLLTAPAWLFDDVATSFRTIQLINAVVMSLGAVAVFWLARRLGIGPWVAVALAAFTLAIPDMFYAGWILADPFAFPLVLASIAAATTTLDKPTKRAQFAFVAFAGLATFARVQFVVLPVCFVVALAIVGLRERRLRKALGEQRLALGLLSLGLIPVLVAGRSVLGYYDSVVSLDLSPLPILRWMGADGMLLLYSSGWVLVPGALMGLALALWKPRSRAELGFAVFGSLVALAVLFEAALYAANGADRIQERYFFSVLPLIGLLFALYVNRGFPIASLTRSSPGRRSRSRHEYRWPASPPGTGRATRPFSSRSECSSRRSARSGRRPSSSPSRSPGSLSSLPPPVSSRGSLSRFWSPWQSQPAASPRWVRSPSVTRRLQRLRHDAVARPLLVDHADLGNVALLPPLQRPRIHHRAALLEPVDRPPARASGRASPPDAFTFEQTTIGDDGSILVGGEAYTGPLLVDAYSATTEFRGARQVARTRIYKLYAPTATLLLLLYVVNRYYDGWLGLTGSMKVWPEEGATLAGRLQLALSIPPDLLDTTMRFKLPDGSVKEVDVKPGKVVPVSIAVCSPGPWTAVYEGPVNTNFGERLVTVRSTKPVFTPDASAC